MGKIQPSHLGGLVNVSPFRKLTAADMELMFQEAIREYQRLQEALDATTISGQWKHTPCGMAYKGGMCRDAMRSRGRAIPLVTSFLGDYLQGWLTSLPLEEYEGVA